MKAAIAEFRPDLVFLATPNEFSHEVAPALLDAGATVVDLSGSVQVARRGALPKFYGFEHTRPDLLQGRLRPDRVRARAVARGESDRKSRLLSDLDTHADDPAALRRPGRRPKWFRRGRVRRATDHLRFEIRRDRGGKSPTAGLISSRSARVSKPTTSSGTATRPKSRRGWAWRTGRAR